MGAIESSKQRAWLYLYLKESLWLCAENALLEVVGEQSGRRSL
jgi:hypothetical protein